MFAPPWDVSRHQGRRREINLMEDHWETGGRLWVSGGGKQKGKATDGADIGLPVMGTARRTSHNALAYAAQHLGTGPVLRRSWKKSRTPPRRHRDRGLSTTRIPSCFREWFGVSRGCWRRNAGSTVQGTWDTAWVSSLENRILANEVMAWWVKRTEVFSSGGSRGDEWQEIAEGLGTKVDRAQCRLRRGLEKARERVLGSKKAKSKPLLAVAKIS